MTEHSERSDSTHSDTHSHADTDHGSGDHPDHHHDDGDERRVIADHDRSRAVTVTEQRTMSGRSFLAGFLTAAIAAVIALVVFLAVSDADDDGEIQVDVPAVDVDVDG